MRERIRTYEDLLKYKESLQIQLKEQKELIYYDIQEIKEELKPVQEAVKQIGHFFVPSEDHSWLVKGTNTIIDMLLRNIFLRKSGWVVRAVVPFLVHNISSHLVAQNKNGIVRKVFNLFSKSKK